MAFNWKVFAAYMGMVILAGFLWPVIGLTPAQGHVMDGITAVLFLALLLLVSPVARHNVTQAFRRGAHQWVGNGPVCERCAESKAG